MAAKAIGACKGRLNTINTEKKEGWEERAEDIRRAMSVFQKAANGDADAILEYLGSDYRVDSAIRQRGAQILKLFQEEKSSGALSVTASRPPVDPDDEEGDDDDRDQPTPIDQQKFREAAEALGVTEEDRANLPAREDGEEQPDDLWAKDWTRDRRLQYARKQKRWIALHESCKAIHRFRLGRILLVEKFVNPDGFDDFVKDLDISRSTANQAIALKKRAQTEENIYMISLAEANRQFGITRQRRRRRTGELSYVDRASEAFNDLTTALNEARADPRVDPTFVESLERGGEALRSTMADAIKQMKANADIIEAALKARKQK